MAEADMVMDFREAFARFNPGDRVWIAGGTGEPVAALDALREDPEIARGLEFHGVWLPGVNRRDPSEGVPGAVAHSIFINPGLRPGFEAGRVRLHPLHYSAMPRRIGQLQLAGAFLQVSPPQEGMVTSGLACDFAEDLVRSPAALIGQVNSEMPAPPTAPRIPVERFSALIEAPAKLITLAPGAPDEVLDEIAQRIAALIAPDDTVVVGIGRAGDAVLSALKDHRALGYHAGMISDALPGLLDRGVFSKGVTTGVALGSNSLYRRAARDQAIRFAPVSITHDPAGLAAIPRLVSITSAIEIDLLGQINTEMLGQRQISGHGGAADFQRGANASEGGRAILALPSTAGRSRVSRILPGLAGGTVISVPRADAGIVVTEHGVARLDGLDIDARAQRLIAIADPAHRDWLSDEWDAMRRCM